MTTTRTIKNKGTKRIKLDEASNKYEIRTTDGETFVAMPKGSQWECNGETRKTVKLIKEAIEAGEIHPPELGVGDCGIGPDAADMADTFEPTSNDPATKVKSNGRADAVVLPSGAVMGITAGKDWEAHDDALRDRLGLQADESTVEPGEEIPTPAPPAVDPCAWLARFFNEGGLSPTETEAILKTLAAYGWLDAETSEPDPLRVEAEFQRVRGLESLELAQRFI